MVTQWQSLFFKDRFAHTHQKNADFVKLGEAMGVKADRAVTPEELDEKLKWLLFESGEGPALLEVVTDQKVPVLPMVPGGAALHEFLVYDEGEFALCVCVTGDFMLTNCTAKEKARRQQTRDRSGR